MSKIFRRTQLILVVVMALTACRPQSDETLPKSVWGDVITVGTAEQSQAPAVHATRSRVNIAWIGADDTGVHQDIRTFTDGTITPTIVLPLPPTFPRESAMFQARQPASLHLLWLDTDSFGQPQLYGALIDETLGVFRGPVQISRASARCYDVLPDSEGALWAVWSGGTVASPALYSALIEGSGLPLRVQEMVVTAGCPAIARAQTAQYVLWTDDVDSLQIAQFFQGRLTNPRTATAAPHLNVGDDLRSLRIGSDGKWLYVFWNIKRVDGMDETWFTAALPDIDMWEQPRLLRVQVDDAASFETTYNTGTASAAAQSDTGHALAWAAPLPDMTSVLPVAVESDGTALALVYFRDGAIVGYQQVTTTAGLLGEPELKADQNRHLYLAWSEQTSVGAAEMRIASTRPLLTDD